MKSFKDIKEEILLEGGQMYPADEMTMKELKIACYAANNILDRLEDGAMIQRWQISAIVKASEELASVYTSMSADMGDYEDDMDMDMDMSQDEYGYPYMYGEETETNESSFIAKAAHSKVAGKKKFKLSGSDKEYPVTISHDSAKKVKKAVEEEMDFKVSVEGLPDMYVKANSPSEVKANLRKIVKKPDMVRSVDRVTQSMIKKIFRDKATGKEDLDEKLKASDDMGDWVKDFQDSDAPQFKGKSQKKRQQMAIAAKLSAERNEEVELDEVKDNYTINHKTFSSAVQHAKSQVEKQGYTIDGDEWDRKVAMGPKKPGSGKTNRYTIELMKDGKLTKRMLHMQVYYDEGRYELNMYIS